MVLIQKAVRTYSYLVHIFQLEMIVLLLNQAKSIWHRNTMFPTTNMIVRQCCMRDGHGAVTVGSEIAAGVMDDAYQRLPVYEHRQRLKS